MSKEKESPKATPEKLNGFEKTRPIPFTNNYRTFYDGDKTLFGIVDVKGKILCPNILTTIYEPANAVFLIEDKNGKFGAIDMAANICVLPEYDKIEPDIAEELIFYKGDKKFYITQEGQVVDFDLRNDPEYEDLPYINSNMIDF